MKRLLVGCLAGITLICALMCGCAEQTVGESCSVFIYLCGSNLESKEGLASRNLDELLSARFPSNVRVVIETGGSNRWESHGIDAKKLQRYEVKDKQLVLVEELPDASMGDSDTFRDFLAWGLKNYPAERNMLILWDHGGKSAESICFDQRHDFDGLDRYELREAFDGAGLEGKFNLAVFDACFMSSLENAVLMSNYADYLIASQEVIPSVGLDYKMLPHDFGTMEDEELGRSICDRYLSKCEKYEKADMAELALLDLSEVDEVEESFDVFCESLKELQQERDGTVKISGATTLSALYGSTSSANLFDLSVFAEASTFFGIDEQPDELLETLQKLVVYNIKGRITDCEGISLYYPMDHDMDILHAYLKEHLLKGYAELLKSMFDDIPDEALVLDDAGTKTKDGSFRVTLNEDSLRYLASVTFRLTKPKKGVPDEYVLAGEGCDVRMEWDKGTFQSDFDGTWPTLGGQPLLTSVFQKLPNTVAYAAPVEVNGDRTNFVTVYRFDDEYQDGTYVGGHLWLGYDENDIPSKDYFPIKAGDEVAVCAANDSKGEVLRALDAFTVPAGANEEDANRVEDAPLKKGTYRYQMVFTDILGRTVSSDYGVFEVDRDGAELVEVVEQ